MDDVPERIGSGRRHQPADRVGRVRAEDSEGSFDRLKNARDAAECERSRDEPDNLAVLRPVVPPNDLNGIGR